MTQKHSLLTGLIAGGIAILGFAGCTTHSAAAPTSLYAGPTSYAASPMGPGRILAGNAPLSDPAADGMAATVAAYVTPVDAHDRPDGRTQVIAVLAPRVGSAEGISPEKPDEFGLRAYQMAGNDNALITGPTRFVHYALFVNNGAPGPVQLSGHFAFPARKAAHGEKTVFAVLNGKPYKVRIEASVPRAHEAPASMPPDNMRFPDE